MVRKQPFSWCTRCGNWAFNFRIIANDRKCFICQNPVDLFKKGTGEGGKPPWHEKKGQRKQPPPAPDDPMAMLKSLAAIPALAGSLGAL